MNLNNKQGFTKSMKWVIVFGIIIFIFILMTIGVHQIVWGSFVEPVRDQLVSAGTGQLTPDQLTFLYDLGEGYNQDFLNYDIVFLITFIGLFTGTIIMSNKARKLGIWSFFGMTSIGSMVVLFLLSIVEKVRVWLFDNIINQMFDMSQISTPIIDWFINNTPLVCFIWFLVLLFVNQIDVTSIFGASRKIEEDLKFENE